MGGERLSFIPVDTSVREPEGGILTTSARFKVCRRLVDNVGEAAFGRMYVVITADSGPIARRAVTVVTR